MRIYLVQHGRAQPKDVDPDRNLTEQGRNDVERISAFLKKQGICVGAIWHSGKTRAQQTAKILVSAVACNQVIIQQDGLSPNDKIGPVKESIVQAQEDLLIVGHLPFLSKLASELVTGNVLADIVAFRPGGVVCLEQVEYKTWRIGWIITPELLV